MWQLTHNIKTFRRSQNPIDVKDSSIHLGYIGGYNKPLTVHISSFARSGN